MDTIYSDENSDTKDESTVSASPEQANHLPDPSTKARARKSYETRLRATKRKKYSVSELGPVKTGKQRKTCLALLEAHNGPNDLKITDDGIYVKCILCSKVLSPTKFSMDTHRNTKKHMELVANDCHTKRCLSNLLDLPDSSDVRGALHHEEHSDHLLVTEVLLAAGVPFNKLQKLMPILNSELRVTTRVADSVPDLQRLHLQRLRVEVRD